MVDAAVTAGEVWGMTASILTVLTLILGGLWKATRLATRQITATRDNTTAIAQLTRRLGRLEGKMAEMPKAVVEEIGNGQTA